jgi:cytochrome P450
MVVDIPNLCSRPLLQSIYAEVLRLRSGTVINRVPTSSDFHIGGWHFKKGQQIIVSTYDTARDQSVWNQGTVDDPHSVNEFWPERFILYPDNPNSGPLLPTVAQQAKRTQVSTLSEPTFSLDGTAGSWIPYGGGTRMCPGRHFAKKEMIVTMAMFLMAFDIELLTEEGSWIQPDLNYFMFGVMHPKGKIPARIRKREF